MRPSHVAATGDVSMVDVGGKPATERSAHARATVALTAASAVALRTAMQPKGDAFAAAQIAGIMAAKATSSLIPLAHPIALSHISVDLAWSGDDILIDARARTAAQTGVEMEAMTAAAVAALTLYDMTKSLDKGNTIGSIRLIEKRGGKSGTWRASEADAR